MKFTVISKIHAWCMAMFLISTLTFLPGQLKAQPNILLIISDDLNTRIGPYMDIREHTPNLDRLAEEGIRFTRTYCQYPLCGPSRASLMSGLYPDANGVKGNSHVIGSFRTVTPQLSDHPSLAGFFKEQGYYSGRVSKIFHMGVPGGIERGEAGGDDPDSWDYAYNVLGPETMSPGTLELLSPGNLHYGSNFSKMIIPDELQGTQTDYMAVNQAIAFLENRTRPLAPDATNLQRRKPHAPFFLGVGLVRPHVPLIAPENCFAPYPADKMELPVWEIGDNVPEKALVKRNMNRQKMSLQQQKEAISAYMASVRFMDQQVGRLMDALDRLGVREETIVVFISDHGFNLGEHDCWAKHSLWEGTVRVPFIISSPDNKEMHGRTCNQLSELIDLYPTLVDLAGMKDKQPEILQGKSLAPYVRGEDGYEAEDVAYTITHSGGATIRTDRYRYTRWGEKAEGNNEELYDHKMDPNEFVNLVGTKAGEDILVDMRMQLEKKRATSRQLSKENK